MKVFYRKNENFFFLNFMYMWDFEKTLLEELEKKENELKAESLGNYVFDIVDFSLIEDDDSKKAVVGVAYFKE